MDYSFDKLELGYVCYHRPLHVLLQVYVLYNKFCVSISLLEDIGLTHHYSHISVESRGGGSKGPNPPPPPVETKVPKHRYKFAKYRFFDV